ncbi:hypothetical protein [Actinosynnema sp. NPDC023587]|uniref:hypothetical protein n=1 Tax=Actinosynnema sp. NPDC023587 TaxID=3154695 RepID=UPI003407C891
MVFRHVEQVVQSRSTSCAVSMSPGRMQSSAAVRGRASTASVPLIFSSNTFTHSPSSASCCRAVSIVNFPTLAGSDNPVIANLPWLLSLVAVAGLATAWWLRRYRPSVYEALGADLERDPTPSDRVPAETTD